jgi:hypothetical protein
MTYSEPVMNDASDDVRNSRRRLTSVGSPSRGMANGSGEQKSAIGAAAPAAGSVMKGVAITPGWLKHFSSKAALFDAIVTESWSTADEEDPSPLGDVVEGLGIIGRRYAQLLGRAQVTDLFRIVIAELPRFPELANAQFSHGKLPYFESVRTIAARYAASQAAT